MSFFFSVLKRVIYWFIFVFHTFSYASRLFKPESRNYHQLLLVSVHPSLLEIWLNFFYLIWFVSTCLHFNYIKNHTFNETRYFRYFFALGKIFTTYLKFLTRRRNILHLQILWTGLDCIDILGYNRLPYSPPSAAAT